MVLLRKHSRIFLNCKTWQSHPANLQLQLPAVIKSVKIRYPWGSNNKEGKDPNVIKNDEGRSLYKIVGQWKLKEEGLMGGTATIVCLMTMPNNYTVPARASVCIPFNIMKLRFAFSQASKISSSHQSRT